MLTFVRKEFLWRAWDDGLDRQLASTRQFNLKSVQDLAIYDHLKDYRDRDIAEIGGGRSRLLRTLRKHNRCVNVDKFEGHGAGPKRISRIRGVKNVVAYLGETQDLINDASFDAVVSVSVVEHVPLRGLGAFLDDGLRILRPGGLWLHAIDYYLADHVMERFAPRFDAYCAWLDDARLEPLGEVTRAVPVFAPGMASNPDNIMYEWGRYAPALIEERQVAQCVSILLAARKRPLST